LILEIFTSMSIVYFSMVNQL